MKVGTYISGGWRGFSIDIEDGPFKDVNVRRAIAYSLDKAAITEAADVEPWRGARTACRRSSSSRAFSRQAEVNAALKKVPTYSVQPRQGQGRAREVGVPEGVHDDAERADRLRRVPASRAGPRSRATSKIGINVKLNIMPGPQRFQVILDHKPNLGIQVLGQAPDSPHPMQNPDLLYTSDPRAAGVRELGELQERGGRQADRTRASRRPT